jgi:hypothetical protein
VCGIGLETSKATHCCVETRFIEGGQRADPQLPGGIRGTENGSPMLEGCDNPIASCVPAPPDLSQDGILPPIEHAFRPSWRMCGVDRGPQAGILTPRKVRTASKIAKLPNLLKRTFMMHRTR